MPTTVRFEVILLKGNVNTRNLSKSQRWYTTISADVSALFVFGTVSNVALFRGVGKKPGFVTSVVYKLLQPSVVGITCD